MGFVKATLDTIGNNDERWKEVIRCEEMTNDVLMVKRKTQKGIIDNGTTIVVKPGQCAAIFKNGKIMDATAEAGTFVYEKCGENFQMETLMNKMNAFYTLI